MKLAGELRLSTRSFEDFKLKSLGKHTPFLKFVYGTKQASKICSKRLWRSEIETNPEWNHDSMPLKERQQRREACKCHPSNRWEDW